MSGLSHKVSSVASTRKVLIVKRKNLLERKNTHDKSLHLQYPLSNSVAASTEMAASSPAHPHRYPSDRPPG